MTLGALRSAVHRVTSRSRTAHRLVRALRARSAAPQIDPRMPATPRDRREALWELLAPHLATCGVAAAREDSTTGATTAVLATDLRALHRALLRVAGARQDLRVLLHQGTSSRGPVRIGSVSVSELAEADRLTVGSHAELSAYRIGLDGHLILLVVQYDPERNRFLARDSRARRVDWTELFARREACTEPTPRPAIGARPDHPAAPIDVVYTWVDSTDPLWRREHEKYSGDHSPHNASANNSLRYLDRDELRFSMRSLWMFAPFVRHIYVVTADQRPGWLADHPQVTLVPHREIFPEERMLPTFNSHAIEACLHRIPGLAENFLYFNDDVFLGREVTEATFFTQAGLAKVRLSPSAFIYAGPPEPGAIPTDWAAYNAVSLIERDFSITIDRKLLHVPFALKRSVLAEIDERYPEVVGRTREARFRSRSDVALPSMLAQYYGMASHRAVEWPHSAEDYVYLNTGRAHARRRYETILSRRPAFFCLNSTRYDEIDLDEQTRRLGEFTRTVFPAAAPWEADSPA